MCYIMYRKQDIGDIPSLKQIVYDNLKERIVHGDLPPGIRVTEEDISQTMNISRPPIREALSMLERDGFVKIFPRRGAVVAQLTQKDIIDIWKCRLALEPFAAREALHNIPKDKIELALTHIDALEVDHLDFQAYIASDLEVHGLYYEYLDNQRMQEMLENLKTHSIRMRWFREEVLSDPSCISSANREHRIILDSMLSRSEEMVFSAVQTHIISSSNRLATSL